jgi:hypothetical protein
MVLESPLTYKGRALSDQEAVLALGRAGTVTLVDAHLLRSLARWRWTSIGGYAFYKASGTFLARLLLGAPPFDGAEVDHRDGDKLNNKRDNLRWCLPSQNKANRRKYHTRRHSRNTSNYKGVVRHKQRWVVRIQKYGQVGGFTSESEAARMYDRMARQLYGEFACVNFPEPGERSALSGDIVPFPSTIGPSGSMENNE